MTSHGGVALILIFGRRILVMTFLVHRMQLWREMLDGLASEAQRLRHMLGLPENRTWGETQHELDSSEYIQLLS